MFLSMARTAALIITGLNSFLLGMNFDVSDYVTRGWQDPAGGVTVISQPLDGDLSDYFKQNYFLHKTTINVVQNMTNEQKIGQLFMPAWEKNMSRDEFITMAQKYHINAMMTLRNDVSRKDMIHIQQALQLAVFDANEAIVIKPLLALDAEPSLLRYRLPESGYNTKTASLDTVDKAHRAGEDIAGIISAQGYNLNFAPVYDSGVNTTVIADRAFAVNSQDIADRANAFVSASMERNVIPTAKHFPGHGYAVGDTHKTLESVPGKLPELAQFRSAISNQVPVVMVGHLVVDGGQYSTEGVPATLSGTSSKLLRDNLDFQGLSITDALTMGALDRFDLVDQRAFDAGMDLLLMPRDIKKTYQSMLQRMQTDSKFIEQVNSAVYRIIRLKLVQQWTQAKN